MSEQPEKSLLRFYIHKTDIAKVGKGEITIRYDGLVAFAYFSPDFNRYKRVFTAPVYDRDWVEIVSLGDRGKSVTGFARDEDVVAAFDDYFKLQLDRDKQYEFEVNDILKFAAVNDNLLYRVHTPLYLPDAVAKYELPLYITAATKDISRHTAMLIKQLIKDGVICVLNPNGIKTVNL